MNFKKKNHHLGVNSELNNLKSYLNNEIKKKIDISLSMNFFIRFQPSITLQVQIEEALVMVWVFD